MFTAATVRLFARHRRVRSLIKRKIEKKEKKEIALPIISSEAIFYRARLGQVGFPRSHFPGRLSLRVN